MSTTITSSDNDLTRKIIKLADERNHEITVVQNNGDVHSGSLVFIHDDGPCLRERGMEIIHSWDAIKEIRFE